MIKLFKFNDKEFDSNGDKIIQPLKAQVYKEDNGEFYLDLETDLSYINDLKLLAILVVPLPQGEQAFRISRIQKTRMKIIVKAYHVYYDSKNYLIKDNYESEYLFDENGKPDTAWGAQFDGVYETVLEDVDNDGDDELVCKSYSSVGSHANSLGDAVTTIDYNKDLMAFVVVDADFVEYDKE